MPTPLFVTFAGGLNGPWRVVSMDVVKGAPLAQVTHVAVCEGGVEMPPDSAWTLRGVVGHVRYTTAEERKTLSAVQAGLGRPEAVCAALIPMRKSQAWWDLAQDERRAIFEERSRHTSLSLKYLPAIARRLHHSRDLGEPFDFLTWFEFAPEQKAPFDELLVQLRASEEWQYVEREVEIRLEK